MSRHRSGKRVSGSRHSKSVAEDRFGEAIAHHRAGRLDEATKAYDVLQRAPDSASAWSMKGVLAFQQGEPGDDYVQRELDDFAEQFDDVLVNKLGYQGPKLVQGAHERAGLLSRREFDVLDAFRRALRPSGALVFTAEAGADEALGWQLNDGGRYAHHDAYLRRVLEQAGFEIRELSSDRLRYELGAEVRGWVVAANTSTALPELLDHSQA